MSGRRASNAEIAEAMELEDVAVWAGLGPGWHEIPLTIGQIEYPFVWVLVDGSGEDARATAVAIEDGKATDLNEVLS